MNFKFSFIFLALFCFSYASAWDIEIEYVHMDEEIEGAHLSHSGNSFFIERDGNKNEVQNCFIDESLRNLSTAKLMFLLGKSKLFEFEEKKYIISSISPREYEQDLTDGQFSYLIDILSDTDKASMSKMLSPFGRIYVKQLVYGEYSLHLKLLLPGGGVGGAIAGAWFGKFVASAVCHGSIYLVGAAVSAVATPATGAIVIMSLETTLGPTIETITTTAALAAGISAAAATGPV